MIDFSLYPLNRFSERRHDSEFVEQARRAPTTRFVVLAGGKLALRHAAHPDVDDADEAVALFTQPEIDGLGAPALTLYLGHTEQDEARFAVTYAEDCITDDAAGAGSAAAPGWTTMGLRAVAMDARLPPALLGIVGAAQALFNWHQRHGFCANCGAASTVTLGGWRRDCPACQSQHFPRVDPVVIMLTVDGDRCLLGRQPHFAPGMYSALAGFLEPGETIEHAVRREVQEESGVRCGKVTYFASQPWPFPSSLMIGCFAHATSTDLVVDQTELEDARWFTRQEVTDMLAGTHAQALNAPKPYAIAHHLMRAFAEHGEAVLTSNQDGHVIGVRH